MTDRDRVCQRAGCQRSASVTLSFRYDARQASLTDLIAEKDPAHYDLCAAHADLLIVPRGWERLDRRTPRPEPEIEAFVRSIEDAPATASVPPPPPATRRMDRYAALTAELPRLAAAQAHAAERAATDDRPGVRYEPVTGTVMTEERVLELEGQLQMSIEPESEGVVVALTRARQG